MASPNKALDFDGTNDYVAVSNPSSIPVGNESYTIEAWFYADQMGTRGIVGWGNYGSYNQVTALRLDNAGIHHYWWSNDISATTGDISGAWHHIAATWDGTNRKLYLDGVYKNGDQPGAHVAPNANNFRIGSTNQGTTYEGVSYFDGKIDEIRIWNVARTQSEIQANMNKTLKGSESGLVAYYKMNEGSGTSLADGSSNSNTATMINMSEDDWVQGNASFSDPLASSNSGKTFTLDPYDNLTGGTTYLTRVTTGVKDTAGNALSSQYETSSGFTTSSSSSSSSATAISLGSFHTCMLDNGSVKCWGRNNYGQLGIDNTTDMGDGAGEMALIPTVNLGTGRTATAISAGYGHTCAILDNASVKCWGRNNQAQLGIDNTTNMGDGSGEMAALPSIDLGTGRTATAIATGNYHTCALLDNASVKCWGNGGYGQLGLDNNTKMGDAAGEMAALPSIDLGTGRTATAIATGYYHSCALLDDGSVKCWGFNAKGQLGIDNTTNMGTSQGDMAQLTGINLGTGRTATAIGAAVNNTCALLDNASVKCWGDNYYGQLGINNETTMGDGSGEMAQLSGINLGTGRTATAISVGYYHSCALLDNASVKCWGKNGNGQLGLESTTYMGNGTGEMAQLTGINLGTDRTATAISAGMEHSCALLDNASVKCWGDNDYGQLGIDNTTTMGDGSGEMDLLLGIDL